jgi:hypothetical protein
MVRAPMTNDEILVDNTKETVVLGPREATRSITLFTTLITIRYNCEYETEFSSAFDDESFSKSIGAI